MNTLTTSGCPYPHAAPPSSALASGETELYLDTVLASIADGIIGIDNLGIIKRANDSALKMFGYEADEVIGKNVSMLMPEPYRSRHDSILARKSGASRPDLFGPVLELKGERKDGSCFDIGMAISIMPPGSTSNYVSVIRIPDQALEFVDIALRHSIRLQKLTQQLLDADQLSNAAIDVPLASQELAPIVRLALEDLQQTAALYGVQLPSISACEGQWVWADNFRLKRVICSVLDNAIRYSPRGSRIELGLSALNSNMLRLTIKDAGSGIPQELQQTIFSTFASSFDDSSAFRAGMGLSLPISHGFMQQMQGSIGILESSKAGTTFYIDLLLAAEPQAQPNDSTP